MKQGWEIKKLGDVCTIKGRIGFRGYTRNDLVEQGKGAITLSPSNIVNDKLDLTKCQYISWHKYEESPEIMIYEGDIIFAKTASIGKVAVVKDLPEKATINPQFVVFKEIQCSNNFLYYVLRGKNFIEQIKSITNGVAIPTVSQNNLAKLTIPIPPIAEQEKIVAELDCLSGIIEKKKQQLKEYDALAQSIFYEMFGNPVDNEKGWNTKRIEEICDVYRGGSPRPIEKFLGGNIPWIKIGDATQGDSIYLTKTKEHIIEEGLKKTRFIHSGSLIFANCGVSLGFARIITFDGCIHDGWLAFDNVSDEIEKIFFLKSINFCTQYFRSIAPDGVQPNLNTTIMKAFKQILPPLELQKRFVEIIQSIEKQKQLVAKSLEETETLFNSRMDYYFN